MRSLPLVALLLVACSGASSPGIPGGESAPAAPATDTPATPAPTDPSTPPADTTPAPAPVPAGPKRVFVTVQIYSGDLRVYASGSTDGFAAGDAICAKEAATAGLGGTAWKAFLSGRKNGQKINAIDRIVGDGPWLAVDGKTTVFDSRARLSTEPLTNVDVSADGKKYRGEGPWTGTSRGVASGDACEDNGGTSWQNASSRVRGLAGDTSDTSSWSDSDTIRCDSGAPLYCFEQ